jgi:cytoskeleton protein RodZ
VNDRESLGSHLKRERESRNISLKEVAKRIRVREQLLRALEEDRYDVLPPHPYLKGFLFNYAKVVGRPLLRKFRPKRNLKKKQKSTLKKKRKRNPSGGPR